MPIKRFYNSGYEIEKPKYEPIIINGRRPKILIVEDDIEMYNYLVSLLNDTYICDQAYNGKQALLQVKRMDYDLISSDVMMPEIYGFQFRAYLNTDPQLKNTPFIMLTARSLEEDKLKRFQLGIDDYITKPFSTAEFKARVHNLLINKIERNAFDAEQTESKIDFDTDFVKQSERVVLNNIDNTSFSEEDLASELNYSSRQLGRKLQKLTGLMPVNFILEIRLQKAYQLLKDQKYSTVNEVRYDIGIESASYFGSRFKERFEISPGEVG